MRPRLAGDLQSPPPLNPAAGRLPGQIRPGRGRIPAVPSVSGLPAGPQARPRLVSRSPERRRDPPPSSRSPLTSSCCHVGPAAQPSVGRCPGLPPQPPDGPAQHRQAQAP
nr:proline-rich protein HaeIII subfamily 1-like [Aegilops tauschii subsp. strangulata]